MKFFFLFFLIFTTSLLSAPWPFSFWRKTEPQSQQEQQKKWLYQQQTWNKRNDPRSVERKMSQEHQKWERMLRKKNHSKIHWE